MTVGRICQRQVDLAESEETAQAAGQRMSTRSVGSLVILNPKKQPVGILTDRDLALKVVGCGRDPNEVRVGELMSESPDTVREDTPIEEALALMRSERVRRLPVVGFEGSLVGVIALDDILALLAEELAEVSALVGVPPQQ